VLAASLLFRHAGARPRSSAVSGRRPPPLPSSLARPARIPRGRSGPGSHGKPVPSLRSLPSLRLGTRLARRPTASHPPHRHTSRRILRRSRHGLRRCAPQHCLRGPRLGFPALPGPGDPRPGPCEPFAIPDRVRDRDIARLAASPPSDRRSRSAGNGSSLRTVGVGRGARAARLNACHPLHPASLRCLSPVARPAGAGLAPAGLGARGGEVSEPSRTARDPARRSTSRRPIHMGRLRPGNPVCCAHIAAVREVSPTPPASSVHSRRSSCTKLRKPVRSL